MNYTFSHSELTELINKVSESATKRTLEELGLLKTTLTRAEVEKTYGKAWFNKSLDYVSWQKKGTARTSPVVCQRKDFEMWLSNFDEVQKKQNYDLRQLEITKS